MRDLCCKYVFSVMAQAGLIQTVHRRFMAELGKVVPILPLVTKADSMTIREAAAYRREVYRKLQNPQIPGPQGACRVALCDLVFVVHTHKVYQTLSMHTASQPIVNKFPLHNLLSLVRNLCKVLLMLP